jgi:hypothetical protein
MINLLAAASLDLNDAWNMSWGEGIQFIIVLAFVYWLKVQIDTRAGLGKKKLRQLKTVIKEAILETTIKTGKP